MAKVKKIGRIDKLTAEQQAAVEPFRAEWFAIGSSCEPADRASAELAIVALYAQMKIPAPTFRWELSPLAAARFIRDNGGDVTRDGRFWGQQEAAWIARYVFARDKLGISYAPERNSQLDIWVAIARSCGWLWPYERVCVVSDRPSLVAWSAAPRPRLHSATGPAVEFRDGYAVYSWEGTRVPKRWIVERDTVPVSDVLAESNADVRTAGLQIVGWSRVLNELGASIINEDSDPAIGTLYRIDLPGEPNQCILRATCGTGRQIALRVPPQSKTALEANAWTYGLTGLNYHPEGRT